ncbi:MAG TPA: methyltransferase [Streptosporangiaceae bacterium]|nr:methyltransferase [Streptosporangiaceae bacterium]
MSTVGSAACRLRLLADAQLSRAIGVAATLGLADHMTDGPQPPDVLAKLTGCDPGALRRMLRYLAFAGVFGETDGCYGLTPMARLLRSDEPGSLRPELSVTADDRAAWWSTGELLHTVRTGQPAYDHVYGMSFWDAVRARGAASTRFQAAMAQSLNGLADDLAERYDWSGVATLADLGGGQGTVLARLLSALPRLRGILVDLPSVTAAAPAVLAGAGVADRCSVIPGDLLEQVPAGADRYLMLRVLHDWPDAAAGIMLAHCRAACGDDGRLVVIDMEVGGQDAAGESLASDVMMMLLVGGRERTRAEFTGLLDEAGFAVSRVIGLRPPYIAIEATPV